MGLCAASEPTITALGHTLRKLRMFAQAAACFNDALSILPGQASTFAGLAYTYHLEVGSFLRTLPWCPKDAYETEMRLCNPSILNAEYCVQRARACIYSFTQDMAWSSAQEVPLC